MDSQKVSASVYEIFQPKSDKGGPLPSPQKVIKVTPLRKKTENGKG